MYFCQRIADKVSKNLRKNEKEEIVSASTVYCILKKNGYGSYKPTIKPGLTQTMKDTRLAWCITHKDID
jgi:hypothetical protein